MSGDGKRVLPASATTTAALIPITQGAYQSAATARAGANDDLIDQLVGGLIQSQQPSPKESRFFGQNADFGAQSRTYSIDDEEIDEPPVPIPSTWRDQTVTEEPSWIAEQLRASAYGFAIGLFVVIPAVLLLTGQFDKAPSLQDAFHSAKTAMAGLAAGSTDGQAEQVAKPVPPADTTTTDSAAKAPAAEPVRPPATTGVATQQSEPAQQTASQTTPPRTSDEPGAGSYAIAGSNSTSETSDSSRTQMSSMLPSTTDSAPATITKDVVAASTAAPTTGSPIADVQASQPAEPSSKTAPGSDGGLAAETSTSTASVVVTNPPPAVPEQPKQQPQVVSESQQVAATQQPQATDVRLPAGVPLTIAGAQETAKQGDMDGARIMLAKLASKGDSEAIFALAEMFDPNVLAAWGIHGEKADSDKAKMFYSMAQKQGVARAGARLQALQQ